jgi:hypothetical protein
MKDNKNAFVLADESLIAALDKIEDIGDDDFRDAKLIMELLKDKLVFLKEEEDGGENNIEELSGVQY